MHCPRDSADLTVRDTEGHIGFLCPACHGAWLPAKYVQSIEYMRRFTYSDFVALLAQNAGAPGKLGCPSGCEQLRQVDGPHFSLCWCPTCHGVWFDRGEIARLLEQHELREKPYPQVVAEQTAWSILVGIVAGFIP